MSYDSEITQLKNDARKAAKCDEKKSVDVCNEVSDMVIFRNASVLTMASGDLKKDLIHKGEILVKGGVILQIFDSGTSVSIDGAVEFDLRGGSWLLIIKEKTQC